MRSQVISEQPPVAGGLVQETKWNTIMFIESCFDTCGNAQSMFNPLQSWSLISHISWYLIMSHILSTLRCCSLILICQLLTWSSHGRNAPASLSAILSMHWASRGSWVDLLTSFDCQTVSDCQMRKPWWWKEKRWWKVNCRTWQFCSDFAVKLYFSCYHVASLADKREVFLWLSQCLNEQWPAKSRGKVLELTTTAVWLMSNSNFPPVPAFPFRPDIWLQQLWYLVFVFASSRMQKHVFF